MRKDISEIVRYIVVGVLTTIVNFIVFFGCTSLHMHWLIANTLSWLVAVVFAYFTNRKFVFESVSDDMKSEFLQFAGLRLMTLAIESGLLFICIQMLAISENIAKIAVSFITIIGNYVFCKYLIFKKGVSL